MSCVCVSAFIRFISLGRDVNLNSKKINDKCVSIWFSLKSLTVVISSDVSDMNRFVDILDIYWYKTYTDTGHPVDAFLLLLYVCFVQRD